MGVAKPDSSRIARVFACLSASAEGGEAASEADLRRFLKRMQLPGGRRNERSGVERIAEASDTPAGRVRDVLSAYCGPGAYCGDEPRCDVCPAAEHCPYPSRRPGIKDLPAGERPRERLIQNGAEQLSNADLLGIIIRDGITDATAVDLARNLLTRYDGFSQLAGASIKELCRLKGIGPARAAQIKAALTIGRRMQREAAAPQSGQFTSSGAVYAYCRPMMSGLKKEVFSVMLLDTKHRLIRQVRVSEGSLTASVVHPREAFRPAIRESAYAVIFIHNHPSGDPSPSGDDAAVTRQMREAGEMLNIKVLDHVIIGRAGFYSFADEGLLTDAR